MHWKKVFGGKFSFIFNAKSLKSQTLKGTKDWVKVKWYVFFLNQSDANIKKSHSQFQTDLYYSMPCALREAVSLGLYFLVFPGLWVWMAMSLTWWSTGPAGSPFLSSVIFLRPAVLWEGATLGDWDGSYGDSPDLGALTPLGEELFSSWVSLSYPLGEELWPPGCPG